MPAFGAVLGLSSQALFFEVTTEKTDKSQAVGGRGIPPFKERRVGHRAKGCDEKSQGSDYGSEDARGRPLLEKREKWRTRLGRARLCVDMTAVKARRANGESLRAIARDLGVSPALLVKRTKGTA
jgi:hypothetical protein